MRSMTKVALIAILSAFAFGASAQDSSAAPRVINYETPGNLAPTHALGCIGPDKIPSTYTPADPYPAEAACVEEVRWTRVSCRVTRRITSIIKQPLTRSAATCMPNASNWPKPCGWTPAAI